MGEMQEERFCEFVETALTEGAKTAKVLATSMVVIDESVTEMRNSKVLSVQPVFNLSTLRSERREVFQGPYHSTNGAC